MRVTHAINNIYKLIKFFELLFAIFFIKKYYATMTSWKCSIVIFVCDAWYPR